MASFKERVWAKHGNAAPRRFPLAANGKLDVYRIANFWQLDPSTISIGPDVLDTDAEGKSVENVSEIRQWSCEASSGDGVSAKTAFIIQGLSSIKNASVLKQVASISTRKEELPAREEGGITCNMIGHTKQQRLPINWLRTMDAPTPVHTSRVDSAVETPQFGNLQPPRRHSLPQHLVGQQPMQELLTLAQPVQTADGGPNTSSCIRKRKTSELWSSIQTSLLLELYAEKGLSINKGRAASWSHLANELNARCGTDFTDNQCKNKWDNLKKAYLKEKAREAAVGGQPSKWEFFDHISDILSNTPKLKGLSGGFINDEFVIGDAATLKEEENVGETNGDNGASDDPDEDVDTASNNIKSTNTSAFMKGKGSMMEGMDVVQGKMEEAGWHGVKKRKPSLESIMERLEHWLAKFTNLMQEIELRRLEADKERSAKSVELQLQISKFLASKDYLG